MRVEDKEGFGKVVILSGPDIEAISGGSYTEMNGITVKADFNQAENIAEEVAKERSTLKPDTQRMWFRDPRDISFGCIKPENPGMTPNDLEIMIHFYVSPAQHPRQGAVDHDCERLEEMGLLMLTGNNTKYKITQKGKAWMRCILDTPFPKNVWLDDHGHIIDINE